MELYQLKTFVVVADEKHLTRASERLHASQSTVSAHVKALERELDTTLFIRTPKGMRLTETGERLLPKAERVLEAAGELRLEARSLGEHLTGEVRIGLNTDAQFLRIVPLVASLSETHPGITPQLLQSSSTPAQEDIRAGKLDCAFIFGRPRHPDIMGLRLERSEYFVAVPHVWAHHIEGGLPALSKLPWLREPKTGSARSLFEKFFVANDINPLSVIEVDGDEVLRVLVAAGRGVSFLRADEIELAQGMGEKIHAVPFDGLSMELYFALMKRSDQDPVMRAVVHQVRAIWDEERE